MPLLWERLSITKNEAERRSREWLEALGLWELRDRKGYGLSGGEKERILALMVLSTGSGVIFLDEPSAGARDMRKNQVGGLRRA